MRKLVPSVMACALLGSVAFADSEDSSAPVAADARADGTVSLTGGSVAAGVGYVWGHGKLTYQDTPHTFTISGLSIVDVGAANISATGYVYNLKKLSDFAGNYVEVTAGATIAGGGSVAYLKNERGVVIKVEATTVGLRFNLSADGVNVKLKS
jgi:hypothetical protein